MVTEVNVQDFLLPSKAARRSSCPDQTFNWEGKPVEWPLFAHCSHPLRRSCYCSNSRCVNCTIPPHPQKPVSHRREPRFRARARMASENLSFAPFDIRVKVRVDNADQLSKARRCSVEL